jgi:hypothetical protein
MATITTANFLALADNVAKTCLDLNSALITNPVSNSPTLSTITFGQTAPTNSLQSRVLALNDIVQEGALAQVAITTAANISSFITVTSSEIYTQYTALMLGLEILVGGVNAYLTANGLQVHTEFASAFNYMANNAVSLNLATANYTPISVGNQNAGRSVAY